jgi:small conductance mechanosensitive channel
MNSLSRALLIAGFAGASHLAVILLRRLGERITAARISSSFPKAKTVAGLSISIAVFALYFGAAGLVLKEFGVSLKTYLASASVIGLAIGFGSQGLVQDVVTGLTLVFSDLFHVGDMVEISGQTGIVRRVGMRFTVLENSFGAEIFIPNRTISNVVNYPLGYIRAIVDIILSKDKTTASQMEEKAAALVDSTAEQIPGIFRAAPSVEGRVRTGAGKEFLRVKFSLWPGRGGTIETAFKQELVQGLKEIDPSYADWMVTVNYEVEKKLLPLSSGATRQRESNPAGQHRSDHD